jgi:hemerythrin superfamily protein
MGIVPTDDLISLLEQDHQAIRERFSELDGAAADDRPHLFWELVEQLVRHEVAEEAVVYPAVRQEPGGATVAEARVAEEAETEQLLARIEKLDPTTEEFVGAVRDLYTAVLQHAEMEEQEVFGLLWANEEPGYLALLGQKFKGEKLAAPSHPHPHAPHAAVAHKFIGPIAAFVDRVRDDSRARASGVRPAE